MKRISLFIVTILFFYGCGNIVSKQSYVELQNELNECKNELEECKAKLAQCQETLENTPQARLMKGQQLYESNDWGNAKKEFQSIIKEFAGSNEARKAENLIAKMEQIERKKEKEKRDLADFNKYIDKAKSKGYTCIKTEQNAVYIIHSLTADQTQWEYYESGKRKITYRAMLKGSLPFDVSDMNLIGWELIDSKGNKSLGAVAINLSTYKRAIVLYKNGQQQVLDEIR